MRRPAFRHSNNQKYPIRKTRMGYVTHTLGASSQREIRTRGMDGRQTVHQTILCDARNREF